MELAQSKLTQLPYNPGTLCEEEFDLLYALRNNAADRAEYYRKKAERDLEKLSRRGRQQFSCLLKQLADQGYITAPKLQEFLDDLSFFDGCSALDIPTKRQIFADQLRPLSLTEQGRRVLEPYRMKNAIIMAAGFSSRFAPISYERPKGTLRVKGEVLIERQIEQLIEAGIEEIVVVLGYLKEEFFYLEQKYPQLRLLINEKYQTHNNMSSLYVAREYLSKSYICCSDNYYVDNIFEDYVFASFYCAIYIQGPTDEMLIHSDKYRVITSVDVGGRDAYAMMGHAAVDSYFVDTLFAYVDERYDRPESAAKLWEEFYVEHIDVLKLRVRNYENSLIREFDSLDDLRKFDPQYIVNSDTLAFSHIRQVLHAPIEDIEGFLPIKTGVNRSFSFMLDGQRYVYRHPATGSYLRVDRAREKHSNILAHTHGIDSSYLQLDETLGWKLSYFIDSARSFDPKKDSFALRELFVRLHALQQKDDKLDSQGQYSYDLAYELQKLLVPIKQAGYLNTPEMHQLEKQAFQLIEALSNISDQLNRPLDDKVLCHHDLSFSNLCLSYEYGLQLIDWEAAAYNAAYFDYASYAVLALVSDEEGRKLFSFFDPEFSLLESLGAWEELEFAALDKESALICLRYLSSMAYMAYYNFMLTKAKELQINSDFSSCQFEYWRLSSYYMKFAHTLAQQIGALRAH